MIPIHVSYFDTLTNPTISRDDLFSNQKEFSQISKIKADQIKENYFRYQFIEDKDNKMSVEIKIKKDDESFQVLFMKDGSNEIKRLNIKDSKMAEFEATCKSLSHRKESFVLGGDGFAGALLVVIGLVSAVVAYTGFCSCLGIINPSEILTALACAVAGTAVAIIIALFWRNDVIATNEANEEADRKLAAAILNKHLTVIQAVMKNAEEISPAQLSVS